VKDWFFMGCYLNDVASSARFYPLPNDLFTSGWREAQAYAKAIQIAWISSASASCVIIYMIS
jgi:hypothetical protein